MAHELVCSVDLGSNSFRLMVGRIVGDQIYPLDSLKESVRLAAGLGPDKQLDASAQQRALDALHRFRERLRGFAPDAVRAVATNTLRVAKNAPAFLAQAEKALGFPIEVIAGREEARLIYVGVAHTMPDPSVQQLVVDIGGGSTEFIIGANFEPQCLESLYMGCVSYSMRFFKDGAIDRASFKQAEMAARQELQSIVHNYRSTGWSQAVGSSGSAKVLCDIMEQGGLSNSGITREGLEQVTRATIKAGHTDRLQFAGLKSDRVHVFVGGLAIMSAIFKEFDLEHMVFSDGALRLGVMYDLLGRYHRHDLRDSTVQNFMMRYQVDRKQADRVTKTALALYAQLSDGEARNGDSGEASDHWRFLHWSSQLHEIGLSVAHSSYHKHTAYILANADMPGFSRKDQARLARLALVHRGKLERALTDTVGDDDWALILCLRLAVILNRSRDDGEEVPIRVEESKNGFVVITPSEWLQNSPLTAATLRESEVQWAKLGKSLQVRADRSARRTGAHKNGDRDGAQS